MKGLGIVLSVGDRRLPFQLASGGPGIVVGRGNEADVSVPDGSVSRRHCVLSLGPGGLELRDLASANGTFVNGQRIGDVAPVRPGDAIVAGKVPLKIEVVAAPAAAHGAGAPDPVCEGCRRPLTLATIKDGQVGKLRARALCPACQEAAARSDLTGFERFVEALAAEGFQVVARLSPASSLAPIFKAKRPALGDVVAIKVLPLGRGVAKTLERFQTEARAMAQIQHPNVIRVYDVRARQDLAWLVMEFVEGETLLHRIEREGKVAQAQALAIGVGLARALEAIAKQGIVHRDVKPANVIVARDGTPKLTDFGLAKDLVTLGQHPTGDLETLGTLRYAPPEQALDAKSADYRSDIYALAATIYHALTGKLPHPDRTEADLLRAVVSQTPLEFDPSGTPGIPEPVCRVLARALRANPSERHRSAAAFREDLIQATATVSAPTDRLPIPRPTAAKPGAMSGAFENEQLVELVQMLGHTSKTGFLAVTWPGGEGQLAFKEGKVVAARTRSGAKGPEATLEVLELAGGTFDFRPGVPSNFKVEHQLAVEGLLLEAMRRRDEKQGR